MKTYENYLLSDGIVYTVVTLAKKLGISQKRCRSYLSHCKDMSELRAYATRCRRRDRGNRLKADKKIESRINFVNKYINKEM